MRGGMDDGRAETSIVDFEVGRGGGMYVTVPAAYAGELTGSEAMVLVAGASVPEAAVMALVGRDEDAASDAELATEAALVDAGAAC